MMNVIDYLKAKYGVNKPTTILLVEAKSFGIEYPLKQGWLWRHGNTEITPEMANNLEARLKGMIEKDHPSKQSAMLGLDVLRTACIHLKKIPSARSKDFLMSKAWKRVRIQAFEKFGNRCQCCGASPHDGVRLNVDHIKPRALFPHLALSLDNLQILCEECNEGKGNWNMSNWKVA